MAPGFSRRRLCFSTVALPLAALTRTVVAAGYPAPGWLKIATGCCQRRLSLSATRRAMTSGPLPAAPWVMILTGRAG